MVYVNSINLWEKEHRPNYRILSIKGEILELKQTLYWMRIVKTHEEAVNRPDPDGSPVSWEVPPHGRARAASWDSIAHIEAEIKKGEEMIAFLQELLKLGILWYDKP